MNNIQLAWEEVVKQREILLKVNYQYWYLYNLFSFGWWFLLAVILVSYIIWWVLVDKRRIIEVLTFGLSINAISSLLDLLGTQFMLWGYPNMLMPTAPPLVEINYGVLPVAYSLLYQFYPTWKSFIIAITIMALVFSFVFEPILVWMKIYEMHHWTYIYSFPIYLVLGIIVKCIVDKAIRIKRENL
jgi:hypothetical protein